MCTLNVTLFYRSKRNPSIIRICLRPWRCDSLQCLELPMYRAFHGPKDVLVIEVRVKFYYWPLTLSVPNFRRHLSYAFFILTNCRLERLLYVKLKDWISNSIDPDETAHWAVSSGSMLFAKAYYYRLKSTIITCERVKEWFLLSGSSVFALRIVSNVFSF